MNRPFIFLALLTLSTLLTPVLRAQAPAPVVLQAVTPVPAAVAPAPAAAAAPASATAGKNTLRSLTEIQTTNAEILKKQEAALATLDELQKAAEEIKIFSKRG